MNHFKIYNFLLITFIISIFIFIGCQINNTDNLPYNGIITGLDLRACPCCGGYFIKIDSTTYDFTSLPPNANFTLENATFPIYVNLDWRPDTTSCGNYIDITRIEKVR
jgi:hypothetical protein